LKDISIVRLNGLMQYLVMAREQSRHGIRILLCEFGTAFNIGEEEGDGA